MRPTSFLRQKSKSPPIIIVGTGVSSLATAAALKRTGFNSHIISSASQKNYNLQKNNGSSNLTLSNPNAPTQIWIHGLRAAQRIGIHDELIKLGRPVFDGALLDSDGNLLRHTHTKPDIVEETDRLFFQNKTQNQNSSSSSLDQTDPNSTSSSSAQDNPETQDNSEQPEIFASLSLQRKELHHVLMNYITSNSSSSNSGTVTLDFDNEYVDFQQDLESEKVEVALANGTKIEGSAIVGADGIHSSVRKSLFPEWNPSSLDYSVICGVSQHAELYHKGTTSEIFGPSKRFGYFPLREPDYVAWFAFQQILNNSVDNNNNNNNENNDDHSNSNNNNNNNNNELNLRQIFQFNDTEDLQTHRVKLLERLSNETFESSQFAPSLTQIRELIDNTDPETLSIMADPCMEMDPSIQDWSFGLATLVGNASHVMSPSLWQAECLALEDAVQFAQSLGKAKHYEHDIPSALYLYCKRRKRRAKRIYDKSHDWGYTALHSGKLAMNARNLMMRLTPQRLLHDQSIWLLNYRPPTLDF